MLAIQRRKLLVHISVLSALVCLTGYLGYEWRKAVRTKTERSAALGVFKLKPGPWGDVSCVPIRISPPLECVPETLPGGKATLWCFPRLSREQMGQFLAQLSLPEPLRQWLLSEARPHVETNGWTVSPSRERVLGLTADERSRLYFGLAQFPENFAHAKAFRYCGESVDDWFHNVPLTSATLGLVKPLVYRVGRFLFFADLPTIESDIATSEQRRLLIKALSQEQTFLMKLNVAPHANIEALTQYWGRRGQAKDIRPILESLAGIDSDAEGEDIGISHLLPPFARRRIFTYPVPSEVAPAINRDCHWTALNFFAEVPSDDYCNPARVAQTIVQDYHRVYSDFRVGDLALFFNGPDSYMHSAVYIADDVYFTKNGSLATRPWMLMRLQDLLDYYPSLLPIEVRHYRRNDY